MARATAGSLTSITSSLTSDWTPHEQGLTTMNMTLKPPLSSTTSAGLRVDTLRTLVVPGLPLGRLLAGAGDVDAFALVDGARVADLRTQLMAAGCEFWCLLCADLDGPLRDSAPYLVRLHRAGEPSPRPAVLSLAQTAVLLLPGTPACGTRLRAHLRQWLRAPLSSGGSTVFRFYDPHDLPATLSRLEHDARRAFLAPLGHVFAMTDGQLQPSAALQTPLDGAESSAVPLPACAPGARRA